MGGGLRTEADTTAPPPFLLQLALASARACDTAESRQRVPISGVSLAILSSEPVGTAVDGAQRGRGWLWMPVGARTGCPNGEARNGVRAPRLTAGAPTPVHRPTATPLQRPGAWIEARHGWRKSTALGGAPKVRAQEPVREWTEPGRTSRRMTPACIIARRGGGTRAGTYDTLLTYSVGAPSRRPRVTAAFLHHAAGGCVCKRARQPSRHRAHAYKNTRFAGAPRGTSRTQSSPSFAAASNAVAQRASQRYGQYNPAHTSPARDRGVRTRQQRALRLCTRPHANPRGRNSQLRPRNLELRARVLAHD